MLRIAAADLRNSVEGYMRLFMAIRGTYSDSATSILAASTMLWLAHIFFFGAYFFLNNPFVAMSTTMRFSTFSLMICAGAAMSLKWGRNAYGGKMLLAAAFVLFYSLAAIRLNYVMYDRQGGSMALDYQQAGLSLLTFLASIAMVKGFDSRKMLRVLFWSALPCGIWISIYSSELANYEARTVFQLGNLSYETYQTNSAVLALGSLSALGLIDRTKLWAIWNGFYLSAFLFLGYFVFQGLGRGEALGFAIAAALLIAPRLTLVIAPFSYTLLTFFTLAFDTPLTARLRVVLDGDYGARDELFQKVLEMISSEPTVFLFGGGLNYFQSYWSLTSGYYPHNIFLEGLVSGGIGLFATLLACFVLPLFNAYRRAWFGDTGPNESILFALAIFLTVIALKSGSIMTFWGLTLFTCVFVELLSRRRTRSSTTADHRARFPVMRRPVHLDPRFNHQKRP